MKTILTIIIVMAFAIQSGAQDTQFSQFYSNPLYLAPSFAGGSESTRFVGVFRDQWTRIPGNFVTYSFTADHYFEDYNSGLGVMFLSDQAGGGKIVTNIASLLYSYKIRISYDFYLQPGISAYYNNRFTNYSQVTFADQYFDGQYVGTSSEILPDDRTHHADFAVSLMGYTEHYWAGVDVRHLMSISPVLREDYKYADMRFSVFGGKQFIARHHVKKSNNHIIHAAFNYRYQAQLHQLDLGAYYLRRPLILGLWYRGIPIANTYPTSDALIFHFGFQFDKFTLNYSFDMSLGQLISTTGGSHEISILYTINTDQVFSSRRKHRPIPCPTFF